MAEPLNKLEAASLVAFYRTIASDDKSPHWRAAAYLEHLLELAEAGRELQHRLDAHFGTPEHGDWKEQEAFRTLLARWRPAPRCSCGYSGEPVVRSDGSGRVGIATNWYACPQCGKPWADGGPAEAAREEKP